MYACVKQQPNQPIYQATFRDADNHSPNASKIHAWRVKIKTNEKKVYFSKCNIFHIQ
jgi:hypothetical protein